MGHVAQEYTTAVVQHRPQSPAADTRAVAEMQRIVDARIPAAQDIQSVIVRIRKVVRTKPVQLPVDTAMATHIVEYPELDMAVALEQMQEQDTEWNTG